MAWGSNELNQLGALVNTTSTPSANCGFPCTGVPTAVLGPGAEGTLGQIVAVAAGATHSLALRADGTVWAWGDNSRGQLGDGTTTRRETPVQVNASFHTVAIAAGVNFSMALTRDGWVHAWGTNSHGQLGRALADSAIESCTFPSQSSEPCSKIPLAVGSLDGKAIVAGSAHVLVVSDDGTVWSWGDNSSGQLGRSGPPEIRARVESLAEVTAVAAGQAHSLAVLSDGTVRAWGSNAVGQLGLNPNTTPSTAIPTRPDQSPDRLTNVMAVAAGGNQSVALTSAGSVLEWGALFLDDSWHSTPAVVSGLTGVVAIAAGERHKLARQSDGGVFGWGRSRRGETGPTIPGEVPARISGLDQATLIAAGSLHSLAVKATSGAKAWGENDINQLGLGAGAGGSISTPAPVVAPAAPDIVAVTTGGSHSLALTSQGRVLGWGSTGNSRVSPELPAPGNLPPSLLPNPTNVRAVVAGWAHNLAVKDDGTVWAWGDNNIGQLGQGTNASVSTVAQVLDLTNVVAVAAGEAHSLALRSDGTVWAWGWAVDGQLGTGSVTETCTYPNVVQTPCSTRPLQVHGPFSGRVVAITAGDHFSLVLDSQGQIWSWGVNTHGQLGAGTTAFTSATPLLVSGPAGLRFKTIAAGKHHALAILGNGIVWTWGSNEHGQLGYSTTETCVPRPNNPVPCSRTPRFVENNWLPEGAIAIAVAGGGAHSVALLGDGTATTWGANLFGARGNGSLEIPILPTTVVQLGAVSAITVRGNANLVVAPRPAPTIASIPTSRGPTRGSTAITIEGSGFDPSAKVRIGGNLANVTSITRSGALQLVQAVTPPGPEGPTSVSIENPDGQTGTRFNAFTYECAVDDLCWRRSRPGLLEPRAKLALAPSTNGRIYAIGGILANGPLAATMEEYDPATNVWTSRPSLRTPRSGAAAATSSNGTIYAIGGRDASGTPLRSTERYSRFKDNWEVQYTLSTPRADAGAVTAYINPERTQEAVFVFGGQDASGLLSSVEMLETNLGAGWFKRAPMNYARARFAVVTGPNGKIYVFGGVGTSGLPLDIVEEYDPVADTWTVLPNRMPTARVGLGAGPAANERIYVIGGFDANGNGLDVVEEFYPATHEWSAAPRPPRSPMLTARGDMGVATASSGVIYAVGGTTTANGLLPTGGSSFLGIVEEYSPGANAWAQPASMVQSRMSLGVAQAPDGRIFALGGTTGQVPWSWDRTNKVEIYNPATRTWSAGRSMPSERAQFGAAFASNGKLFVAGGVLSTGTSPVDTASLEEYDPTTNTWTNCGAQPPANNCAPMPTARSALSLVAGANGKLYAIGGWGQGALATVEEYDPATNIWTPRPPMPTARMAHAAARAADGKIYVAGGWSGSASLGTVESFDPSNPVAGWTSRASLGVPRSDLGLVTAGTRLYAVGGSIDSPSLPGIDTTPVSTVEEYDTVAPSPSWRLRSSLTSPRSHFGAVAANGRIYAIGGLTGENRLRYHALASLEESWGLGQSQVSISGQAACRVINPDGSQGPLQVLGGAIVELFSGSVLVAKTIAGAAGSYVFTDVAPGATYSIHLTSADGPLAATCSTSVTTNPTGPIEAPTAPGITDLRNHTWVTAYPLTSGAGQTDTLFLKDQSAWFKIPVRPGQRVTVELTNLKFDATLRLHKDIPTALSRTSGGSLDAVRLLNATIAMDRAAPDGDSPDGDSPDGDSPDGDSPDGDSPDGDSPDGDSPDGDSPDGDSPDGDSPDGDSGLIFSTAVTNSLIARSERPGTADEVIVRETWDNFGHFYIRVRGANGAYDPEHPFLIKATVIDGACVGVTLTKTNPTSIILPAVGAAPRKTLILTNTARLLVPILPPVPPADSPDADLTGQTPMRNMTDAEKTNFRTRLQDFASRQDVNGYVVDLADDYQSIGTGGIGANYTRWDNAAPCAVAANLVADAIHDVIAAYRNLGPSVFQYVVLAGGDSVIPFRRLADRSEVRTEKNYHPPVLDATASQASLRQGYVLSQDFYGNFNPISYQGRTLYLPEVPVGRLVESHDEILGMLDAYIAIQGVARPTSALVTAYDFFGDSANDIALQLRNRGLSVNTDLVQPVGFGPEHSTAWKAEDLQTRLLTGPAPGILSLNGHFTSTAMLAADYQSHFYAREIFNLNDGRFRNTLVLSPGCHSGYNLVDEHGVPLRTRVKDFPQAFARQGATMIAGTGYQYGSGHFIRYSELLMTKVTQELGAVPVGRALMNAKRSYVQELYSMRGIDEKAVAELTLYGLPMWSVSFTSGSVAPMDQIPSLAGELQPSALALQTLGSPEWSLQDGDAMVRSANLSSAASALAGLTYSSTNLVFGPSALRRQDRLLRPSGNNPPRTASYFDAGSDNAVQLNPMKPVLPRHLVNVHRANEVARGIVLLSADYHDLASFRPYVELPFTETRKLLPHYYNQVFTPVLPFSLNSLGSTQTLVTTPFQYRSDGNNPTGTGRVYDGLNLRVYYSDVIGDAALAAAPSILSTRVTTVGPRVQVEVTMNALVDPGIDTVWATYTSTGGTLYGRWASLALTPVPGTLLPKGASLIRTYSGEIDPGSGGAESVRLWIQAVGGNGLVSYATNNGAYYQVVTETATAIAPKTATTIEWLSGPVPSPAPFGSTVAAQARLQDANGVGVAGKRLTFRLGQASVAATTDTTGIARADLTAGALPGSHQVTVSFAEDPGYLGASASRPLNVTLAPTGFAGTPSIPTSEYSDAVIVATLQTGGKGLTDQPILVNLTGPGFVGRLTSLSTGPGGRVLLDTGGPGGLPAGDYTAELRYEGDDRYLSTTSSVPFTVRPEKGTLTFLMGSQQPAGEVRLEAQVSQELDKAAGNLARATVGFTVRPLSGNPVTASTTAGADGRASALVTLAPGTYSVEANLTGGFFAGPTVTASLTVTSLSNAAPAVSAITAPLDPVQAATPVNVSASFTDPDPAQSHTAVWNWGDGTSSGGAVTEQGGAGSVTGSHTYSTPGVYTVSLSVTDSAGGNGQADHRYVVIYNPAAGFVTGGGWITSPAGAYRPDPTLTGRANFGFVSRYERGRDVPTGNTEFQFRAASLSFRSTTYEWLVVSGARAQFRGTGTINGTGSYEFSLTVIDGDRPGGGNQDKFRIRIWDRATGLIYDNQPGTDEQADPTTVIGGGSIVIHN
jgi:alpha-tubulin suppressor-like RCC1 family protein/N-acetylneuraminic acid mutarotase